MHLTNKIQISDFTILNIIWYFISLISSPPLYPLIYILNFIFEPVILLLPCELPAVIFLSFWVEISTFLCFFVRYNDISVYIFFNYDTHVSNTI